MKPVSNATFGLVMFGLIIGSVLAYPLINKETTKVSNTPSELDQCMTKHRWDTTAVNTSRMAVQMHYHSKGQGELAKYVSDYDAVKIVYCSGK